MYVTWEAYSITEKNHIHIYICTYDSTFYTINPEQRHETQPFINDRTFCRIVVSEEEYKEKQTRLCVKCSNRSNLQGKDRPHNAWECIFSASLKPRIQSTVDHFYLLVWEEVYQTLKYPVFSIFFFSRRTRLNGIQVRSVFRISMKHFSFDLSLFHCGHSSSK